ncbi:predicted protein [Chaetomium globosum CBS 148.51]|uniref:Uncharacterized protein n=1 Tax=Chaetomium globosum (strain ATCC 6205 / CBS 148.51 / DSM 1962 / NBRC 6347 / NRRL 1970) TaxID=306901 RepID=Q2GS96_CHAGB|nr:uncharacterized protein CHGG_09158 [Chaetomium globosum CBS 148.51]EAQ85144.1 predicted protein [Chaetomium globosum CBS 148.51]
MPSDSSTPKKRRQSLLFSVKSIFKGSKPSKPHTSAGPAPKSPWNSNTAGRPESLPTIHEAVLDNDIPAVDRVLAAFPQSLAETDDQGMTPLALAFLHNHLPMARHLHTAGASPLPEHNNEESLAGFAVIAQNPGFIHWLASFGRADLFFNTPGPDGNYPLHQAALHKNVDVVRALLEGGADPNIHTNPTPDPTAEPTTKTPLRIGTPIFYVLDGKWDSSHSLENPLRHPSAAPPARRGPSTPRRTSNVTSKLRKVYHIWKAPLLDHRPAPPTPEPPATDIINLGTISGSLNCDPALDAISPLMYTADTGRAWLVRLVLERGADPHATNALGETALHWAGVNVAGADVDAGNDGDGPEIIRLLVQGFGAEVDARCETGETPLHGAAYRGVMANVRALLELGADGGVVATDLHSETLVGVGGTPEEMARGEGGALEEGLGERDELGCREVRYRQPPSVGSKLLVQECGNVSRSHPQRMQGSGQSMHLVIFFSNTPLEKRVRVPW